MHMHIGKHVPLCDLSNIATNLKQKKGTSTNDLQSIISQLQKDPSVTVEVFTDIDQNLMGIFYQDEIMKHTLSVFPEMLFIDAKNKLNSLYGCHFMYYLSVMEMAKVKLLHLI